MGTHGLYGFRRGGRDILAFRNHSAYPSVAAVDVLEETRDLLKAYGARALRSKVAALVAVDKTGIPTQKHRQRAAEILAGHRLHKPGERERVIAGFADCTYDDLLHQMRPSIETMVALGFYIAIDWAHLSAIEWMSVANLDTMTLDVHRAAGPGFSGHLRPGEAPEHLTRLCSLPLEEALPEEWEEHAQLAGEALAWGAERIEHWRPTPYETAAFLAAYGGDGLLDRIEFGFSAHQRAAIEKIKQDAAQKRLAAAAKRTGPRPKIRRRRS